MLRVDLLKAAEGVTAMNINISAVKSVYNPAKLRIMGKVFRVATYTHPKMGYAPF